MISYALDLNLIPGGVLPRIDLSQYDHGQSVECDLYKGPVPYTIPSGSVAYVEGTKPDKTGFQYEATIASNKVTFEVTNQMTACGGEVVTELVLTHSGDRIATINFILNVEPAALANDTIISETDLPIVQQIPEYMEQIGEYAEEAEAWATGGEEGTPSATNNAKYWAEKSQEYAIGAFHWKNKVAFANLPTSDLTVGDVYEVADAFTTDSRFSEGAGVQCEAGTEVVWTDGGKWSILTPPGVTSFNGRKGAVSPASGDYSASQISSSAITGQTNVEGALSTLNANLLDITPHDITVVTADDVKTWSEILNSVYSPLNALTLVKICSVKLVITDSAGNILIFAFQEKLSTGHFRFAMNAHTTSAASTFQTLDVGSTNSHYWTSDNDRTSVVPTAGVTLRVVMG